MAKKMPKIFIKPTKTLFFSKSNILTAKNACTTHHRYYLCRCLKANIKKWGNGIAFLKKELYLCSPFYDV